MLERKTGVILLTGPPAVRMFLRDGSVLRVEAEGRRTAHAQKEALFEVLDWRSGRFEFLAQDVRGEDRLQSNTTSLLLEHARLRDEAGR